MLVGSVALRPRDDLCSIEGLYGLETSERKFPSSKRFQQAKFPLGPASKNSPAPKRMLVRYGNVSLICVNFGTKFRFCFLNRYKVSSLTRLRVESSRNTGLPFDMDYLGEVHDMVNSWNAIGALVGQSVVSQLRGVRIVRPFCM